MLTKIPAAHGRAAAATISRDAKYSGDALSFCYFFFGRAKKK